MLKLKLNKKKFDELEVFQMKEEVISEPVYVDLDVPADSGIAVESSGKMRVKISDKVSKVSIRGLISESMDLSWKEYRDLTQKPSSSWGTRRGHGTMYIGPVSNRNELAKRLTGITSHLRTQLPDFQRLIEDLDLQIFEEKLPPQAAKDILKEFIESSDEIRMEEPEEEVVIDG